MSIHFRTVACVWFVLATTVARADGLFCQSYGPGGVSFNTAIAAGTFECAGAGAGTGNGAPLVIAPDQAGPGTASAAQVSAGSGVFEASATANAAARPGLLRVFASAHSIAPVPSDGTSFARAIGRADSSFFEFGNLVAAPGAILGDPVAVRLTIDVSGSFLNLGEGTDEVFVERNNTGVMDRTSTVLTLRPVDFMQIDLPGFRVGDNLGLYMRLTAEASAMNEHDLPNFRLQIADLQNSGHLYLDVLSANASFVSTSGHDYALRVITPVPEPNSVAMLAAGLGAILALKRKRRVLASWAHRESHERSQPRSQPMKRRWLAFEA